MLKFKSKHKKLRYLEKSTYMATGNFKNYLEKPIKTPEKDTPYGFSTNFYVADSTGLRTFNYLLTAPTEIETVEYTRTSYSDILSGNGVYVVDKVIKQTLGETKVYMYSHRDGAFIELQDEVEIYVSRSLFRKWSNTINQECSHGAMLKLERIYNDVYSHGRKVSTNKPDAFEELKENINDSTVVSFY